MMVQYCGIDFGTSNSAASVWRDGQSTLVPLEDGRVTMPSALFFDLEEKTITFGRSAMADYIDGADGRLMRALKSVLGTSLMGESTRIGRTLVPFEEILGHFIAHLKRKVDEHLGANVDHVVMGRPVFFVDDDPAADKIAQNTLEKIAKAQGFHEVSFQYEPVAAALDAEQKITSEKLALIVDLGGGTSDFSLVRIAPERSMHADRSGDILSNVGVHIGGTDFDQALSLESAMPYLGYGSRMKDAFKTKDLDVPPSIYRDLSSWQKINFLYTQKVMQDVRSIHHTAHEKRLIERLIYILETHQGHALAIEVEKVKIALTDFAEAPMNLGFIEKDLKPVIARKLFEKTIKDKTRKLQQTARTVISQAGVSAADIDVLFFTGGSAAIPYVRDALRSIAPEADLIEGDRFGSVGAGLALEARRRFGA